MPISAQRKSSQSTNIFHNVCLQRSRYIQLLIYDSHTAFESRLLLAKILLHKYSVDSVKSFLFLSFFEKKEGIRICYRCIFYYTSYVAIVLVYNVHTLTVVSARARVMTIQKRNFFSH